MCDTLTTGNGTLLVFCFYNPVSRASGRKFSWGNKGRYQAPESCWAPKPYRGPAVKSLFVRRDVDLHLTANDIRIQLRPMKNTTRQKNWFKYS